MKTAEEIKKEIKKLEEMKPRVARFSAFGDDHHAAIDAQISVLEEEMSEGRVWDFWPDPETNTHDAAMRAMRWMREESPSEGWPELETPAPKKSARRSKAPKHGRKK